MCTFINSPVLSFCEMCNYNRSIQPNQNSKKDITTWRACIKPGRRCDAQDSKGIWRKGVIIKIKVDQVLVNYTGWSHRYDEWISISSPRLLPRGRETDRPVEEPRQRRFFSLSGLLLSRHDSFDSPHQDKKEEEDINEPLHKDSRVYLQWTVRCGPSRSR